MESDADRAYALGQDVPFRRCGRIPCRPGRSGSVLESRHRYWRGNRPPPAQVPEAAPACVAGHRPCDTVRSRYSGRLVPRSRPGTPSSGSGSQAPPTPCRIRLSRGVFRSDQKQALRRSRIACDRLGVGQVLGVPVVLGRYASGGGDSLYPPTSAISEDAGDYRVQLLDCNVHSCTDVS